MSDATVDGRAFREAIAHFATGVTVVTTTHEGRPAGMTASAVCSLSLDPVLLVVCIDNRLATHKAIEAQQALRGQRARGARRGARAPLRAAVPRTSSPASRSSRAPSRRSSQRAIAHFVCSVQERVPGGDHSIFIGKVLHCEATPGCRPLLYYRSAFGAMHDPHAELLAEAGGWDAGSVGGLGGFHPPQR